MKILILSNDDLTSNIIFEPLFHLENVQIVGVGFSKTLLARKKNIFIDSFSLLRKIDFYYWIYLVFINTCYKTGEFFQIIFNKSYVSKNFNLIRLLCKKKNIPVYSVKDINHPDFCEIVRKSGAEFLVIRINQILGADILSIPSSGVWCVHSSILPAYRGIAAEFHCLRLKEPHLGSSIFKVNHELDKGPSLFQVEFPRVPKQSVFSHMVYNNYLAGKRLANSVKEYSSGKLEVQLVSREIISSYYSWPESGQVKKLNCSGHKLITLFESTAILLSCIFGKGSVNFIIKNFEKHLSKKE